MNGGSYKGKETTWSYREAGAFLVTGATNSALAYLLFLLLWVWFGAEENYLSLLAVTYVITTGTGFFLHRNLVFGKNVLWIVAMPRYVVVVLMAFALNSLSLFLLVELLGQGVLVSQIFGAFTAAIFSFVFHKLWAFRL